MALFYYGAFTFIYLTYYYEHSFKKLMILEMFLFAKKFNMLIISITLKKLSMKCCMDLIYL